MRRNIWILILGNICSVAMAAEKKQDWLKQSFEVGVELEAPAKLIESGVSNAGKGVIFRTDSLDYNLFGGCSFQLHSVSYPKGQRGNFPGNLLSDMTKSFKCDNLEKKSRDGFTYAFGKCAYEGGRIIWMKHGSRADTEIVGLFIVKEDHRKETELSALRFLDSIEWKN